MSLLCNWFSPHLHTCRNTRGSMASDYCMTSILFCKSFKCLHRPETVLATVPGPGRHRPPARWASWQMTGWWDHWDHSQQSYLRAWQIATDDALLSPPVAEMKAAPASGMRRVTESRSSHDTRYFCVQRDQWRVTSCAGLPPIVTIKSRGTFQSRLLSAADISDFLRNNICSSISFPLNYSYIIWLDDHKKSTVSTVNCTNIKSILCLHTETTYMAVFICLKNIIHRFSPLHDQ